MTIRVCDRCGGPLDDSKLGSIVSFKVENHLLELCEECKISFKEWFKQPKGHAIDISECEGKPSNPCLRCDSSVRQICCGCPEYYKWIDKIKD